MDQSWNFRRAIQEDVSEIPVAARTLAPLPNSLTRMPNLYPSPSFLVGVVVPFPAQLPGFVTPECTASLKLGYEKRVAFLAKAELQSPIKLGTILTFEGLDDAAGPEFGITAEQTTKEDRLAVNVFFRSKVNVTIGSHFCLDVNASMGCGSRSATPGDDAGCSFDIIGTYKGGDVKPVDSLRDEFKILANEDSPLMLSLTASTTSLSFALKAGFKIDLSAMKMGLLEGKLFANGTINKDGVEGARRGLSCDPRNSQNDASCDF